MNSDFFTLIFLFIFLGFACWETYRKMNFKKSPILNKTYKVFLKNYQERQNYLPKSLPAVYKFLLITVFYLLVFTASTVVSIPLTVPQDYMPYLIVKLAIGFTWIYVELKKNALQSLKNSFKSFILGEGEEFIFAKLISGVSSVHGILCGLMGLLFLTYALFDLFISLNIMEIYFNLNGLFSLQSLLILYGFVLVLTPRFFMVYLCIKIIDLSSKSSPSQVNSANVRILPFPILSSTLLSFQLMLQFLFSLLMARDFWLSLVPPIHAIYCLSIGQNFPISLAIIVVGSAWLFLMIYAHIRKIRSYLSLSHRTLYLVILVVMFITSTSFWFSQAFCGGTANIYDLIPGLVFSSALISGLAGATSYVFKELSRRTDFLLFLAFFLFGCGPYLHEFFRESGLSLLNICLPISFFLLLGVVFGNSYWSAFDRLLDNVYFKTKCLLQKFRRHSKVGR